MVNQRHLSLAVLVMSAALAVRADPIDPIFSVDDPTQGTPITSTTFTFGADNSGGGIFNFVNESGVTWSKLDFTVTLPSDSTFACGSGPFFTFCEVAPTVMAGGTTLYDISLVGTSSTRGGVGNGVFFTINLNDFVSSGTQSSDPNGSGGWLPGNTFNGTANDFAPEPASWFLLLIGGCAMAGTGMLRRKRTI